MLRSSASCFGRSRYASRLASLFLISCVLLGLTTGAGAQKLARKYFEQPRFGFRVKSLDGFTPVPPKPDEEARGYVVKMSGPGLYVLTEQGDNVNYTPSLNILRYADETVGEEEEGRSRSTKRKNVDKFLDSYYKGLKPDKPLLDEEKKIKKLVARHRQFEARTGGFNLLQFIDVWTFKLDDADIHLIYSINEKKSKKYLKVFEKSAKTFSLIERVAAKTGGSLNTYEEKLAYHQEDAALIPGWRALPVPSEKYIIKTSSDNKKFINEVIKRLESSRLLYEKDFPPPGELDHVSIVRICGSADEFHEYGNTSRGVAGWFNPRSTELVLYDSVETNRNSTYAVMSHEAFHQYCHFLFRESEAHRWFDEGHGDYYGGAKFKRKKAEITSKMPAGLNRLSVIKDMVRNGDYKPVEEHINYTHSEWQSQGPSNVSCYAQSWSIIFMLRQGTLGKLNKRVWKKEYARIIPAYVETLSTGFEETYIEILAEREKRAKENKRELTEEERDINRRDLSKDQKDDIWKKAMEASWGTVDIDEFEQKWLIYVKDFLK